MSNTISLFCLNFRLE